MNQTEIKKNNQEKTESSEVRIYLSDLWNGVKKLWWVCLLISAILGASMFIKAYSSYVPVYTASATLTVTTQRSSSVNSISVYTFYYDATTALSGSYKAQDAQLAFVRNTTSSSNKPIAMLMEGSWWENESTAAFEETYGTGATKYDSECVYKQLPLPKADESKIGSENIWVSPLESYCFINPTIKEEKVDVATKFLQFCHSDESLAQFTKITGVLKPYDYELDESELTPYTQSMLEATKNSTVL
ncbi:MAG: hypothetical protein IKT61_00865, partial [Clostridia bacterium]|nr:hypothetical protein [Clostridia bacterium]